MNDSDESVILVGSDANRAQHGANGASSYGAPVSEDEAAPYPSKAETPEVESAPVQLALFPAIAEPPQLQAPLFHVRCPDCRAINDVPSLPTICYRCALPLGREKRL